MAGGCGWHLSSNKPGSQSPAREGRQARWAAGHLGSRDPHSNPEASVPESAEFLGTKQHSKLSDNLEASCPQNMSPLPNLAARVDGPEPARCREGGELRGT